MMAEQPPKRELTPAQLAALQKARESRSANAQARKRGEDAPPSAGKKRKSNSAPRVPGERAPARPAAPILTAAQRDKVMGGLKLSLVAADTAAAMFSQGQWADADRLTEDETALLTYAVYGELETQPRLLKRLAEFAVMTSSHTWLAICLASVAAPRLARRGVIGEQLAAQLQLAPIIFAAAAAGQQSAGGGDPVYVATGPTPGDSGPDWDGQIHANGVAAGNATPVQDNPPVQIR